MPPASSGSFKKLTPTWLFEIGNLIWKLNFMLNLHLICEYENWVFGTERWEGETCWNYLQVSMVMLWFYSHVLCFLWCPFAPSHMWVTCNMCNSPNKENSCFILPNMWVLWAFKRKAVFQNPFQFSTFGKIDFLLQQIANRLIGWCSSFLLFS